MSGVPGAAAKLRAQSDNTQKVLPRIERIGQARAATSLPGVSPDRVERFGDDEVLPPPPALAGFILYLWLLYRGIPPTAFR